MPSWQQHNKRELFAHMIARTFNDEEQVSLYLQCCKRYPVALIYRAFAEAKSVPQQQVRKSRAAIFFYLVKKYAEERNQNSGH